MKTIMSFSINSLTYQKASDDCSFLAEETKAGGEDNRLDTRALMAMAEGQVQNNDHEKTWHVPIIRSRRTLACRGLCRQAALAAELSRYSAFAIARSKRVLRRKEGEIISRTN
jgi:hypothetical protein